MTNDTLSHFHNSLWENNLELALRLGVCYAITEPLRHFAQGEFDDQTHLRIKNFGERSA